MARWWKVLDRGLHTRAETQNFRGWLNQKVSQLFWICSQVVHFIGADSTVDEFMRAKVNDVRVRVQSSRTQDHVIRGHLAPHLRKRSRLLVSGVHPVGGT